jgi:porin
MRPTPNTTTVLATLAIFALAPLVGCATAPDGSVQDRPPPPSPSSAAQTLARGAAGGGLGGPGSAGAQLETDRASRERTSRLPGLDALLDPIEESKARLNEKTGLDLGLAYVALYQGSTDSLTGSDRAASGQIRLFATWTVLGRDAVDRGRIVMLAENRHRLGQDIAPAALGGEIGYLGLTGATFGDTDNSLTALYWDQSLAERRAGYVAGRIAPDDFTDVLGYANPRTTFQNFAILLNPVIPFPDPGFGGGGGGFITDRVYALGIVSDANGLLTDVEFFPDGAEFFSYGELGWTPSREQRYTTNLHLGAFHVDSRETAGAPESYGLVGSANVLVGEVWMPFGRLGFSDGDAPLANASVTAGVLRYFPRYGDLAGLAFNWADPSDNALDSQFTGELFYRFEVADNIALTADAQLLVNPALNPTEDTIGVFGLRLRFDL